MTLVARLNMMFRRCAVLFVSLSVLACNSSSETPSTQLPGTGTTAGQGPIATTGASGTPASGSAAGAPAAVGGSGPAGAAGSTTTGASGSVGVAAGSAGGAAGMTSAVAGATGTPGTAGAPSAGNMASAGATAGTGGGAGGSTPMPEPQSCAGTSMLRPGATSVSLMSGGASRMYRLYVPTSYKGDAPVPLVLWFHGILGSSQDYRTSGFQEVADREGFVLAAPEGTDTAWNIGPCCTARSRNTDDVGFAKAIVADVKGKACIDAKRVYSTGFSMGGGMSHWLACNAADVFAAVAPSAFDLLQENVGQCKPSRPITVASFRNKGDNFVLYDGTPNSTPPNTLITGDTSLRINILGAKKTLEEWGRIQGCTGMPEADGAGCETYKTCPGAIEVTLCSEDDPIAGHHPGPAPQMWERLKRFQLP